MSAYRRANWTFATLPPAGAPVGPAEAAGTVSSSGAVRLAGLEAGVEYFAYALVGGEHRYVAFTPDVVTAPEVGGGAQVGVRQVAADIMRLFKALGGERYWGQDLRQLAGLPGAGGITGYTAPFQLSRAAIYEPFLNAGSPGVRTGTFVGPSAQAAASGGQYWYSVTAGDHTDLAAPANAVKLGVRLPVASNAGFVRPRIGGDPARANRLPTMQQLIDAGKATTAMLVANGGPCQPTDRILDLYSAASDAVNTIDYDRHFVIADMSAGGAPLGGQTVSLEVLGIRNVQGTSDVRAYVSADWLTYATATTSRGTKDAQLLPTTRILSHLDSAYEAATEVKISGTSLFVREVHGYASQTGFVVMINDQVVTLSVGETRWAEVVELVRDTQLFHTQVGAGNQAIANVKTTYELTTDGLDITHRTTPLQAYAVTRDYVAMFPVDGDLFRLARINGAVYALSGNDGTYKGQARADVVEMVGVDSGGLEITARLTALDQSLSTDDFALAAPMYAAVEDRTPNNVNVGDLSKTYVARVHTAAGDVAIASGAQQYASHRYEIEAA